MRVFFEPLGMPFPDDVNKVTPNREARPRPFPRHAKPFVQALCGRHAAPNIKGPALAARAPRLRLVIMRIQVLGCSGSIAAGARTTSFLVGDDVLVDAGTGVGDLPLDALAKIEHILVSHSHLDHTLAIGLLADSVLRARRAAGRGPIRVHALAETLHALRTHVFNGAIWPDFTRLPSAQQPVLALEPVGIGQVLEIAGKRFEVLPAEHTVPACGFGLDGGAAGWWIYTGDTGPNPALWERLASLHVAHLVIETAFGDEERQLARISRHLCPAALGHELEHLGGSVDVHITHIKPGEMASVMSEVSRLDTPHRITALEAGQVMHLPALPAEAQPLAA